MYWMPVKVKLTSCVAAAAIASAALALPGGGATSVGVFAGESGGNNGRHARLSTGQYSVSSPAPHTPFSPPPSGTYIG